MQLGPRIVRAALAGLAAALLAGPIVAGAAIPPEEQKLYDDAQGVVPRIVVRRDARAILVKNPHSFVATYVLGKLEAEDGQFPDAIRELKRAQKHAGVNASTHRDEQKELASWRARIVLALADALDHADRLEEALSTWAEALQLQPEPGLLPDRTLRRIDALLKLGRVDDAQHLADARLGTPGLTDSERIGLRIAAARILFAREPDGQRAYEAFEAMAREANETAAFAPPFGDLAFHARRQGHIERAKAVLSKSAATQHPASAAHPFRALAEIHLAAADWESAQADLRNAWNTLQLKRADIRHELLADTRLTSACFYLAAGYPERAERLVQPYVSLPVRSGFSSRPSEQWQAGVNLLCWSASRQIRTLERASATHRPWHERATLRGHHLLRQWREALMARRIRALIVAQLASDRPIRDTFVLVDAPVWLWGDLAKVLGPRQFRDLFSAHPLQGAQKRFFSPAMEVEAAYAARDWDAVATSGGAALEAMPPYDVLLRARICQLIAEAEYRRSGAHTEPSLFERAFELDRAAPLKCASRLPVAQIPTQLRGSSLLRVSPGGAQVRVSRSGAQWTGRTVWPSGSEIPFQPLAVDRQSEAQLAHQLHRILFSPVGLLKESDYAALEGNATSGPQEKEDRMDRMLRAKNP